MDEIISNLKDLGLSGYEAKVYLALLKKYPATGYEVSKLANIPQARAYDTLKSLEIEHIVTSSNTKPINYTPIKPKELTKRYKRKFASTLDFLEKKLPDVKDDYTEPILSVLGSHCIYSKIIEIIKNASKEIYLGLWAQDYRYLEDYIKDAYNRGLDIKIVAYDNFTCNFGIMFKHELSFELENFFNGKLIFITADNNEGVFGYSQPSKNTNSKVLWTKNEDIIFLIREYIIHEMYLIDIEKHFPEQLKYFYGKGLKKLKDKIRNGKYI